MAESLSKKDRQELLDYLERWAQHLMQTNPQGNTPLADKLLEAKEYIYHNTNIQLSLEALLLPLMARKST